MYQRIHNQSMMNSQMQPIQQQYPAAITPIVLDSASAMKLSMGVPTIMHQERALMARNDIWHRILILKGSHYEKETVLKSILKAVYPADLIPVKYQVVGEDSCFIARNCDRALDQLCKLSLIVQCDGKNPLVLSITLGFASIHELKINIQPILLTVLTKRYDVEKRLLDLDDFHKDPDVYKTVYCPLSQYRTMAHVLKLGKTALGPFETLYLKNNELSQLTMIDSSNLRCVKYLDLRHNDLLSIELLEPLKTLNILELWLDGNPLCDNYSSPKQYVEAVREYCPQLHKLDGVQVNTTGLPMIFKSYVKNWKKRMLVEQFVEHFFTAYDFRDRIVLRGLYHDQAWYSTTVGTPTSPTSKKCLEPFGQENRNLLIFGKNSQQLLYHGQEQILRVLRKMPPSQHLSKSFCCDLMYDTPQAVCITVEGLFKLVNIPNQVFSFNRTFILCAEEDNEYKIINDQYHVYLPVQGIDSIKYNIESEKPLPFQPTCFSPAEKDDLLIDFQEATTMSLDVCKKYLTETDWDIKKALKIFLDDYKREYSSKIYC